MRPEKLKISKAEPKAAGLIKVQGKVRDVAYYGDTSHVVVAIKGGPELAVNVQNDTRTGGSGVERGQAVWVSLDARQIPSCLRSRSWPSNSTR